MVGVGRADDATDEEEEAEEAEEAPEAEEAEDACGRWLGDTEGRGDGEARRS